MASSGSSAPMVSIGRSGEKTGSVTGRVWMRARPSRTSSNRRGPTPRNEYRPRRSPPSTDSRRYAGPPSSSRRNAPIGVSRSAGRVARRRIVSALAARRCACARLIGSSVVIAYGPRRIKTTFVSGTKGRAFRGATLVRRCRTLATDGPSRVSTATDRRCPFIAGALRRSLLTSAAYAASCSVRRLPGPFPRRRRSGSHQPPDLWVDVRRVLVPFTARYS